MTGSCCDIVVSSMVMEPSVVTVARRCLCVGEGSCPMEEDPDTVRGNIAHYKRLLAGDLPEERRRTVAALLAELEARRVSPGLEIRVIGCAPPGISETEKDRRPEGRHD